VEEINGVVLNGNSEAGVLVDPSEEGSDPGESLRISSRAVLSSEGHDSGQLLDSTVGHRQWATAVTLKQRNFETSIYNENYKYC